ncbi:unnamed protein product [Acanthoscelides obtectus]|uniref:Uncharacterized protein n=2 Tax=Acanthoscelides obtectus TaxID=200917 RepID=A0A9P0L603_ACAOB|nr:unnamed protein product [Acanthoscelides obtectus]CAK1677583.1 mRNA-capping enzyme [Acanthoscelides obtectus]
MKNKIPDGWLDCPANGEYLVEGKFMALKTPLEKYNAKFPVQARYPPEEIFKRAAHNKVKIGLWIDLTNTTRYYSKKSVEDQNCQYVKLCCEGHGIAPSRRHVKEFIDIAHNFIVHNPCESIAVHCTHGYNRTGFLIVAFLVEQLGFKVEDAIDRFSKARPPGIYRSVYIKELFLRYGNVKNLPPPPKQPSWVTRGHKQKCRKRSVKNLEQYLVK